MKKLILLFAAYICYHQLAAQEIKKGDMFIGLQSNIKFIDGFYTYTDIYTHKNDLVVGIHLAPTIQKALAKNFLLGTSLHFGYMSEKKYPILNDSRYDRFISKEIGIAVTGKYYLDLTRNKKLKLFGVGGLNLVYQDYENIYKAIGNFTDKDHGILFRPAIGFGGAFAIREGMADIQFSSMGIFAGFHIKLHNKKMFR